MLLAMSLGLRYGARQAAAAGVGMATGLSILAILSVMGLGALLAASETGFQIVKWAGVAYLAWLGFQTWRAPVPERIPDGEGAIEREVIAPWRIFVRGLIVAMSNPKAVVFHAALFPQFLDTTQALAPQMAVLLVVMVLIEFGWVMAYALGGDRLGSRLAAGSGGRVLNRITGGLMMGAGGLLALARRM